MVHWKDSAARKGQSLHGARSSSVAEGKPEFDFPDAKVDPVDFSVQTPIARLHRLQKGAGLRDRYPITCATVPSATEKDVHLPHEQGTILQREIPPEQVVKLLETGKTDLLLTSLSRRKAVRFRLT